MIFSEKRFERRVLFVFFSSLIKNVLTEIDFAGLLLKLSLPVFLKCFLIFAWSKPNVSCIHISYITTCNTCRT